MANRIITLLIVTGIIGIIAYITLQSPNSKVIRKNPDDYYKTIKNERSEKNKFFKENLKSPFFGSQKAAFKSLEYYPINPNFRIIAKFKKLPKSKLVELSTSNNELNSFLEWGYANFKINGQQQQLLLLKSTDQNDSQLFVPFTDATSARQTYGAGRYLDVEMPEGNDIILDFNKAYNPYCAYSDEYSCPLPPPENMLGVPIQAGEKTYAAKKANTR